MDEAEAKTDQEDDENDEEQEEEEEEKNEEDLLFGNDEDGETTDTYNAYD